MVIAIGPELESALKDRAQREGVAPEELALSILRERFIPGARLSPVAPQDEWERRLVGLAKDCGVSLPHAAVSSEGLYE